MGSRVMLLLAMAVACTARLAAQDIAPTPPAAQAAEQPVAPVLLDGDTLFNVRGVSAYPAERRAATIGNRIAALAADRTIPAESLTVRDTPPVSSVVAAGQQVFAVTDADAELEGVARQVLAQVYRTRVVDAVERFRRDREPEALWQDVARALGATLALVLGFWLGRRLLRWIRTTLDRRYRHRIRDVQFQTISVVRQDQVWRALDRALGIAAVLVVVVASYVYLSYVLLLFPWTRALGHGLSAMLLRPLATLGAGAIGYLPNVVFLVVLALITRFLLRIVRLFFRGLGEGTLSLPGFEPYWAQPTERIVRVLVIAFALVVAYPYIPGAGSEAFKGISILLGVLFSLGSSSVIGNLLAGQSLAFHRALRVGDRIRIGDHVGEVVRIRPLTTYLRSPKNEQIAIPNAMIVNKEVVNYSTLASAPGLILHTTVGIGYETPWRQVEAMLLEAAARTPGILRQPDPFVLQKSLGDFAVVYEINVYADNPRAMLLLYSALHRNILDVFNEYSVQIMTPAYEGDPEQPKIVPRGQWFAAPAPAADLTRTDGNAGSAAGV